MKRRELAGWPVRAKVIVNLNGGIALRGTLWEVHRRLLILRDAEDVTKGTPKHMDGEALIERDKVEFVQVLAR